MKKKSISRMAERLVELNTAIELVRSGQVDSELVRKAMSESRTTLPAKNAIAVIETKKSAA